jgi:iron complex transport system ATP-binding protein
MYLSVKNASFSYGKKAILEDINFSIVEGGIFCLLGPNGTGKSTLLDCIMGVQKLQKGSISIKGESIGKLPPRELARFVSYVPQVQTVSFPFEVIQMVLMGRTAYLNFFSSPSVEDYQIAEDALSLVGMTEHKHRLFTELSGGEKQLVMIARALAQKSSMIIMDEPTAHLDVKNEFVVLETITKLAQNMKLTFLIATHFPNHPFYFADRSISTTVGILNQKRFSYLGTPQEVLKESNIYEVFGVKTKVLTYQIEEEQYSYVLPLQT